MGAAGLSSFFFNLIISTFLGRSLNFEKVIQFIKFDGPTIKLFIRFIDFDGVETKVHSVTEINWRQKFVCFPTIGRKNQRNQPGGQKSSVKFGGVCDGPGKIGWHRGPCNRPITRERQNPGRRFEQNDEGQWSPGVANGRFKNFAERVQSQGYIIINMFVNLRLYRLMDLLCHRVGWFRPITYEPSSESPPSVLADWPQTSYAALWHTRPISRLIIRLFKYLFFNFKNQSITCQPFRVVKIRTSFYKGNTKFIKWRDFYSDCENLDMMTLFYRFTSYVFFYSWISFWQKLRRKQE